MSNLTSSTVMLKPHYTLGKAKVMGVAFIIGLSPIMAEAASIDEGLNALNKVNQGVQTLTQLPGGGLPGVPALPTVPGLEGAAGALSAFGGASGLMQDPDIKKLISSVGKEAACAMLGKAAQGMGQAGSLVGALCNLPSLPKIDTTNVPLTSVGMVADPGAMMSGMMQQMAQQLISKIMEKLQGGGGGDEGGGGGSGLENAGGGTAVKAPLTALAGLKVIQATSAQEQYLNTKNTGHSSKSGYAVVNVPQAAIQGQYSAKNPYTAGTQVAVRIGNYQTVGTSLGGIRMPDGSAAVQVGVRLGAFTEAGVQVANNGILSFDPAQATSVASQVNPVLDLYNIGYEDAVNGRSPNTVFVGASAYDQGYTLGLQARQTDLTIG